MEVLIGVDPHKATNVVAAIDEQGEVVGQETFPANRKGMRALERWAKRFPERRWAVEGAGGIGRPLAQKLLAGGEQVVDVPPKLSAKVRVLSTGNARKNDRLDATFTALAALRNDRLASVQPEDGPEGHAEILRLLTERREDLVAERTRALEPPARAAAGPPLRSCQQAALRRCRRQVVAPRQATASGRTGPQAAGLRAGARRACTGPEDSRARRAHRG